MVPFKERIKMSIEKICKKDVVCVSEKTTIQEVAEKMKAHHVGDIIVTDSENGDDTPIGILTDRDIVVSIVAKGGDIQSTTVGDVMTRNPTVVSVDDEITECIELMQSTGAKRLPVVDTDGALVGIVTADDLLEYLVAELGDLTQLGQRQHEREELRSTAEGPLGLPIM